MSNTILDGEVIVYCAERRGEHVTSKVCKRKPSPPELRFFRVLFLFCTLASRCFASLTSWLVPLAARIIESVACHNACQCTEDNTQKTMQQT